MTMRLSLRNQAGQGLVETLISMLIIFCVVVALLSFEGTLAYNDTVTAQQYDATLLAANKIESLRDYQVLAVQNPYAAYASIVSGTGTSVGTNTTYTVTWTVTPFTSPTYKTIDVVVTWNDRRGVAQTIKLSTIVAGIDPTYSSSVM